jgi:hypothetical protein
MEVCNFCALNVDCTREKLFRAFKFFDICTKLCENCNHHTQHRKIFFKTNETN